MLDPFTRLNAINAAVDDIAILAAIEPAPELRDLRERITAFLAFDNTRATAEIAAGVRDGADLTSLWEPLAFAAATASRGALLPVQREVLALLAPTVEKLAGDHGRAAHAALAKKFNAAAAKLSAGVKVAAPAMTADEAIRADAATQDAYRARADLLATLDTLSAAMLRAAELTGARLTKDAAASLVVDFSKVTPERDREVWEHIDGSTIDWLALAALDVIGARPDALDTPPAPRHPGLVERWERDGIGHGRRLWDPVAEAYVA